jgi:hypothetical protein
VRAGGGDPSIADWFAIAADLGTGAMWRQVADRWNDFLRPELSRDPFSLDERPRMLQLGITNYGKWIRIAPRLALGRSRSLEQIKSEISGMLARLCQLHIPMHGAEDAGFLPDRFFQDETAGPGVREEFLLAREKKGGRERDEKGE